MVVVLVMVNLFEGRSAVDAGGGNAHNGLSTRTTAHACNLYRKRLFITPATASGSRVCLLTVEFTDGRGHIAYTGTPARVTVDLTLGIPVTVQSWVQLKSYDQHPRTR
ncbi:unnamed protein product [Sphagnum balticum]